mmetsp:Transcript_61767/g.145593  ORF Transcript_61767/g.145593 Transcript_61767/m.145593 type:complete len:277 (-) Transcript_61767:175-1005(-)|eukprot:CAMPEP_0177728640 /NCGR_PEP_ID=MMETSP0484_2-20121128/20990_1 /TAXON_ID=354590 /ORGANISM="Rhodomonas lens, Strain RHODO" /LENGTH=276 /DNA_ID=CAMNT_0019241429 /DNA_START=27 /DNA_END=857 /DNA_ORIENTATION=-
MGNTTQKEAKDQRQGDPWFLGCGTEDCRDFGEVCSTDKAERRSQREGLNDLRNSTYMRTEADEGRIRPFENQRLMPGPQPPSFVSGTSAAASADSYHDLAADKYAAGDFDRAEELYLKALQANPRHLRSLCNYGALLQNIRQDYRRAEDMYLKALSVDDRDAIALYNYGLLLENAKHDTAGAETMYQRALAADPDNVDTLCNYGALIKTVHNDYAKAEQMYKAALTVSPNHVDTLCNYALLLRDCLNDADKARELIHRAQQLAPDDEWLQLYSRNF